MNITIASDINKFSNFNFVDYLVCVITLLISTAIGIYFGFVKKSKTIDEYLMGGRKMKVVPIAISIIASQITSQSVLGNPTEMYSFGTQYLMYTPFVLVVVIITNYVFIPVFFKNQISNCYEYLEIRFNKSVRNLLTTIFLLSNVLSLPVTMYSPALAFSQATGTNVYVMNGILSGVCVFYTMLGGIKAVVWTDVFQAIVMVTSSILVSSYATQDVGGLVEMWKIANKGNRIEFFNTKLDLTTRHTFWNTSLGYTTFWLSYLGLSQSVVQRYMSVPSIRHARKVMYIAFAGCFIITNLGCYIGIAMYSKYADCDPLKAGTVKKPDQMVPYFVQDIVGHLMGMPGLFLSCVLCASLSTMSVELNTLSAVLYYDIVRKLNWVQNTDSNAKLAIKIIIIILGMYSILMGFIVAQFQYILQLTYSISSITFGTRIGAFLLATLWPHANAKGVTTGIVLSTGVMGWIIIVTQIRMLGGISRSIPLPTSIEGCDNIGINVTHLLPLLSNLTIPGVTEKMDSFSIYDIAYPWYSCFGAIIAIGVGVIVSFLTGGASQDKLRPHLYPSIIHWMLPIDNQDKDTEIPAINRVKLSVKTEEIANKEQTNSLLS